MSVWVWASGYETTPPLPPGFPVAAMNQGRRVARKPIMPKQQQPLGMGRGQVVSGAGPQRPIAANTTAVGATLMAGAAGMLQVFSSIPSFHSVE